MFKYILLCYIILKNVKSQDECNITACDFIEMARNRQLNELLYNDYEITQTKMMKLERRLRSLEQPGIYKKFSFCQ